MGGMIGQTLILKYPTLFESLVLADTTSKRPDNARQMWGERIAQAKAEGIVPSIYTHPLGMHGHAAGPTIGMWDMQQGVPGSGDYKLFPRTAYSIELNASTFIPEWGKDIRIMLEEDGFYDGKTFYYIGGRQEKLHLVKYF